MKWSIRQTNKVMPVLNTLGDCLSFSQCGEDRIVKYVFNLRGIQKPSYIDIGAHDPFYLSNTALFYKDGARGINIEANPQLFENFKINRPEDINLNIGIGSKEDESDFYIMMDSSLSTFSKHEANLLTKHGKELNEIKRLKLMTLTSVLAQYNNGLFPDFMSLDVEGFDFEIIQSIDFEKSFPKVVCVEAAEYSMVGTGARRNELIDFLVSKGYYEYANTNLNAIMVKNEFWFI